MQPKPIHWLPVHAAPVSARGRTKRPSDEARAKQVFGTLPEWNLADLYPGTDDPGLKADLATSERAATAMQESYAGKLAALADGGKGGEALARAGRGDE